MDARLPKFIFFRDAIVPNAEARVHVLSPAIRYGLLVFDAINSYLELHRTVEAAAPAVI